MYTTISRTQQLRSQYETTKSAMTVRIEKMQQQAYTRQKEDAIVTKNLDDAQVRLTDVKSQFKNDSLANAALGEQIKHGDACATEIKALLDDGASEADALSHSLEVIRRQLVALKSTHTEVAAEHAEMQKHEATVRERAEAIFEKEKKMQREIEKEKEKEQLVRKMTEEKRAALEEQIKLNEEASMKHSASLAELNRAETLAAEAKSAKQLGLQRHSEYEKEHSALVQKKNGLAAMQGGTDADPCAQMKELENRAPSSEALARQTNEALQDQLVANHACKAKTDDALESNIKLRQSIADADADIASGEAKLSALQVQIEEKSIAADARKRDAAEARKQQNYTTMMTLMQTKLRLEEECRALQARTTATNARADDAEDALGVLRAASSAQDAKNAETRRQLEGLQDRTSTVTAKRTEHKAQLQALQHSVDERVAMIRNEQQRADEMSAKLNAMDDPTKSAVLVALQQEFSALSLEIAELTSSVEASTTTNAQLEAQITAAQQTQPVVAIDDDAQCHVDLDELTEQLAAKQQKTSAQEELKLTNQKQRGEKILENQKLKLLAKVDTKGKEHDALQRQIAAITEEIAAVRDSKVEAVEPANTKALAKQKKQKGRKLKQKPLPKQKLKKKVKTTTMPNQKQRQRSGAVPKAPPASKAAAKMTDFEHFSDDDLDLFDDM